MAYQERAPEPIPEYMGRKGKGPMDKEDFAAVVQDGLAQCVQFVDTELSVERARATEYYLGKPFGNEEEGRSQVVLTEVRDAVDGMLPSLLRVFFGSEHCVEFVPTRADNVPQAEQKTDYVRYVFEEDNAGFLSTMSVLKDGLVRKVGIFKWRWDTSDETRAYKQEGVTKAELELLAADDDVALTKAVKRKPSKEEKADYEQALAQFTQAQSQQQPGQPPQAPPHLPELYDVELTRTVKGGRARVESVPPEEFIYNRQARSLDESLIVAHRTDKTRGQLLAMGVKEKDIEEHAGPGGGTDVTLKGNAEEIARRDVAGVGRVVGFGYTTDPELGKANDKILYTEAFMTVDYDGDGVAELRRICTIGPNYYPITNDPADERPFAIFTPYPEPHALLGGSVADRTMDVQKINSAILRAIMDSGAASAFPRTVYLEGQASVADIMNTAIGAPIRERIANAVRTLETPFTGKELLPVLSFMQEVIERRTGRNKGAAGLDADALQSTGKEAVGAVLTGGQEQIEVIARVFAEGTLKPLFRGLGRLLSTHQPKKRVVRLRGNWVDVDPRSWDDNMDVTVNVGLGTTFTEKKIATLMSVAADQKELATALGLSNPIVGLGRIRATRAKILALQGIKDADSYYAPVPLDYQPPPPQGPPAPSPEQQAMQAEAEMSHMKVLKELAIKHDELVMEREQKAFERDMAVRKLEVESELKKYAIDAQFRADMDALHLDADKAAVEHALTMDDQSHTQALDVAAHAHEVDMGNRAADTADVQAEQPEAA